MNDLDRKIGELKGWRYSLPGAETERRPDGTILPLPEGFTWMDGETECYLEGCACAWSTSDSKALELVDELQGKMAFRLECCPSGIMWYATFSPVTTGMSALIQIELSKAEGSGITRPEAICRAYIAAREWMAQKGGER